MTKHARAAVAAANGSGIAMGVISSLFAGVLLWGGIGWLLDRWFETRFLVAIGVLIGMALGVYLVVVKYGRNDTTTGPASTTDESLQGTVDQHSALSGEERP